MRVFSIHLENVLCLEVQKNHNPLPVSESFEKSLTILVGGKIPIIRLKELSGVPESNYEQCIQLLSAGFTPSSCAFLAKKLTDVLIYTLSPLINKYKIEVPLSRTLICIADPSGTLQPGEIFIQLDKYAGIDPRTGLPFGVIEGYVILARNPCLLPSDIIKVKAVKNQYLKNYYNLVIFPINVKPGEGSLANHLSGGDYDGDKLG
ncbi:11416_t:CDS:2 [Entrophospora sp. SA101]|nr:11416_t:CDS:2 [Entrophospora sp. SA101]